MRRVPDELTELRKYLALIVDQKFRKAHHVHEQDMGDFETKIGFTLRSHLNSHGERASKDTLANRRPTVERKLRLSNRRGWAEQLAHPHSIRVFSRVTQNSALFLLAPSSMTAARKQPCKTICGSSSATRLLTSASPYSSA